MNQESHFAFSIHASDFLWPIRRQENVKSHTLFLTTIELASHKPDRDANYQFNCESKQHKTLPAAAKRMVYSAHTACPVK